MSRPPLELVRRGLDAFNRRDFDAALEPMADDVVWEPFLARAETDQPLRGKDAIRAAWESQVEAIDLRVEVDEVVELSPGHVFVPARMLARGSSSEMSLTASVFWVMTVEDDRLTQVRVFRERDEAVAAAGA